MFFHGLVPRLPALPIFGDFDALFASGAKAFGPLFGSRRATAEGVVELEGDFVDVLLVVVLCDLDVGWRGRRLQHVSGHVVLVVCEEGEGQGRA